MFCAMYGPCDKVKERADPVEAAHLPRAQTEASPCDEVVTLVLLVIKTTGLTREIEAMLLSLYWSHMQQGLAG